VERAVPNLATNILEFTSHSPEQTAWLGTRLGELAEPGDVIALSGELGAGKTAFAIGFGTGWGARVPVNSPTFVFVHEHHRAADAVWLYHVDCYRLNSHADAESVGLTDMLAHDAVVLLEWPERVEALLPAERLWITFISLPDAPTHRSLGFEAKGTRYQALLETFNQRAFGR
jgi:tRNA threonylcarbamoyladenosine biosynthesis protein TsaE